jgi:hypothetical protein
MFVSAIAVAINAPAMMMAAACWFILLPSAPLLCGFRRSAASLSAICLINATSTPG